MKTRACGAEIESLLKLNEQSELLHRAGTTRSSNCTQGGESSSFAAVGTTTSVAGDGMATAFRGRHRCRPVLPIDDDGFGAGLVSDGMTRSQSTRPGQRERLTGSPAA